MPDHGAATDRNQRLRCIMCAQTQAAAATQDRDGGPGVDRARVHAGGIMAGAALRRSAARSAVADGQHFDLQPGGVQRDLVVVVDEREAIAVQGRGRDRG